MAPLVLRGILACAPLLLLCMACLIHRTEMLDRLFAESQVMQDSLKFAHGSFGQLYQQAKATVVAGVNHPAGLLVLGELSFLIFLSALMGGIEACRARGISLMDVAAVVPTHFLFSASLSSSLASFCFLWLPFLLNGRYGDRRAQSAGRRKLTDWVYSLSRAIPGLTLAPCFVAFTFAHHHPENSYYNGLVMFASYTQVMFLINSRSSPRAEEATADQMEEFAVMTYQTVALIIVVWRIVTVFCLQYDPIVLLAVLRAVPDSAASEAAISFFLIDLVGLTLALAYLALLEDGPTAAVCTLVGALGFPGPAPTFAIYCVYREMEIADSLHGLTELEAKEA